MNLKFIADVNIEKPIIDYLKDNGYDVLWVTDIDKKMLNGNFIELANNESRVLITNDKDFGEIIFYQKKASYGVILFRVKGHNVKTKISQLEKLVKNNMTKIEKHFVLVTDEKLKFIPLEGIL